MRRPGYIYPLVGVCCILGNLLIAYRTEVVIQAVVHKCHGGVSQPFFQAVKSHVRFDAKCLRFPNWLVGVVRLTIDIIVATQVLEPPVW